VDNWTEEGLLIGSCFNGYVGWMDRKIDGWVGREIKEVNDRLDR
jgi:hypothetical protein